MRIKKLNESKQNDFIVSESEIGDFTVIARIIPTSYSVPKYKNSVKLLHLGELAVEYVSGEFDTERDAFDDEDTSYALDTFENIADAFTTLHNMCDGDFKYYF